MDKIDGRKKIKQNTLGSFFANLMRIYNLTRGQCLIDIKSDSIIRLKKKSEILICFSNQVLRSREKTFEISRFLSYKSWTHPSSAARVT